MKHSEMCECPVCDGIHPKLVLWKFDGKTVHYVELRESRWYVVYTVSARGAYQRMELHEWNLLAIIWGNKKNEE